MHTASPLAGLRDSHGLFWAVLAPNASLQLLPEAGAERTPEAVSCKALLGALATSFALLRIPKMRREDEAFTLLKRNPQALEQISQLCAVAPSPDEDLNLTAARADGRVDRDRKIWGELDVMHKNIAKAPALSPQPLAYVGVGFNID